MTVQPGALRARYATDSVSTASPERLLVMLYDRLLLDLARGQAALETGDRTAAHAALTHAQDIVSELLSSLDTTAWDGAGRLASLYGWLIQQLVRANVRGDATLVAECHDLVQPLRDAWVQAATEVLTSASRAAATA